MTSLSGRILVVDDDDLFLKVCTTALVRSGLTVDAVTSSREALARAQHVRFDAVVSDLRMPDLDGLMLMDAVREHDATIPFVIMTGSPTAQADLADRKATPVKLLQKPFDVDHFIRVISAVVGHRVDANESVKLNAKLDQALEHMYMAYQPIVAVPSRRIFAYESLFRTSSKEVSGPVELLDVAEATLRLFDVGRMVRERVSQDISRLSDEALMFVNLHPADLEDSELYSPAAPLSKYAERVVLEITERASVLHMADLDQHIERLRRLGYRVAIDDLGAGYSGLTTVARIRPHFVKLDKCLVRDVDKSESQRAVVQAMRSLAKELSASVIAEAIETSAEMDVLRDMGLEFMQGYYFARPAPKFFDSNELVAA